MAEKLWQHFYIIITFQNFTETCKRGLGVFISGGIDNPVFNENYAPLDGFVVNG